MLSTVFSVLAPHFCMLCNREGSVLCVECSLSYLPASLPCCAGCGRPNKTAQTCKVCKPRIIAARVWPATTYGDVAKQLVHTMKFNHARAACSDISRLMAARVPALPSDMLVVPVPTATNRMRQRGFDHAKLIAKEFAHIRKLTYVDCLRRHGKTRQVGAQRIQRIEQLAQVFWVMQSMPADARILLIDDVFTTGATIGAAASALRAAGLSRIYAATFARTA